MMSDCLATTLAALTDDDIGLAAQVATLVGAGARPVRGAFRFGKWSIPKSSLKPTAEHSVTLRPARGADEVTAVSQGHRDGAQQIEIAAEVFAADPDELMDTIATIQTALLMVFDRLVTYSHATNGTIYEVDRRADTTYGEFEGPASATSAGFVSRFTLNERSRR